MCISGRQAVESSAGAGHPPAGRRDQQLHITCDEAITCTTCTCRLHITCDEAITRSSSSCTCTQSPQCRRRRTCISTTMMIVNHRIIILLTCSHHLSVSRAHPTHRWTWAALVTGQPVRGCGLLLVATDCVAWSVFLPGYFSGFQYWEWNIICGG